MSERASLARAAVLHVARGIRHFALIVDPSDSSDPEAVAAARAFTMAQLCADRLKRSVKNNRGDAGLLAPPDRLPAE